MASRWDHGVGEDSQSIVDIMLNLKLKLKCTVYSIPNYRSAIEFPTVGQMFLTIARPS